MFVVMEEEAVVATRVGGPSLEVAEAVDGAMAEVALGCWVHLQANAITCGARGNHMM